MPDYFISGAKVALTLVVVMNVSFCCSFITSIYFSRSHMGLQLLCTGWHVCSEMLPCPGPKSNSSSLGDVEAEEKDSSWCKMRALKDSLGDIARAVPALSHFRY